MQRATRETERSVQTRIKLNIYVAYSTVISSVRFFPSKICSLNSVCNCCGDISKLISVFDLFKVWTLTRKKFKIFRNINENIWINFLSRDRLISYCFWCVLFLLTDFAAKLQIPFPFNGNRITLWLTNDFSQFGGFFNNSFTCTYARFRQIF